MENLTLTAKMLSSYNASSERIKAGAKDGIRNAYSLHGSPEALATYRADLTKKGVSIPLVDGTDLIRYTTTKPMGAEFTLTRNASGNWNADYTTERYLEDALKSANNPLVAQALANAYTTALLGSIESMMQASKARRMNASSSAPIEAPVNQDGKKVDDVF